MSLSNVQRVHMGDKLRFSGKKWVNFLKAKAKVGFVRI